MRSTHFINIVRYGKGFVADDFPYECYPVFFPGCPVNLSPVPAEIDKAMEWHYTGDESSDLEVQYGPLTDKVFDEWTRHQVGGFPLLIQNPREWVCPLCDTPVPLMATIADDNLDTRRFTRNHGVQTVFHYCKRCRAVSAYNLCG